MDRPNIILLTIDTLRADILIDNKARSELAPNLSKLAATGLWFEQAITGGSWTQAAFPVLLTSTYASMYGGCLAPLSLGRPNPIAHLTENGYLTAAFSTSPLLSRTYGYQRGFQDFVEFIPGRTDPLLRRVKGGQRLLQLPITHRALGMVGKQARPASPYVSAAEVNTTVATWLAAASEPFFAWIHYMDVHWPYHLEESLNHPKDIAQEWRDLVLYNRIKRNRQKISHSQCKRFVELYRTAVQYMDVQLGQLIGLLEMHKCADRTIIVVVSDHGEEFMDHGDLGHNEVNLHDEIIHVPLLIHLPNRNRSQIISKQVRTLDVMPTVLDLSGLSAMDKMEGRSLVPLWDSRSGQYDEEIAISERWRNMGDVSHIVAIRTEAFKLIWNVYQPEKSRLYDLKMDPKEKKDVRQCYPEKVLELKTHVDQHLHRIGKTVLSEPVGEPRLEETLQNRLRSLGYLD